MRDVSKWLAEMVTTKRIQRLQPSMPAAGELINQARRHIRSASLIAEDDATLAVAACHDAARQAITAHLRAAGYRVSNEAGAHRVVNEYASVALRGEIHAYDLDALDDLRRDRHTAEYGDFASRLIDVPRARAAIELATRVVDAVANELARQPNAGPKKGIPG